MDGNGNAVLLCGKADLVGGFLAKGYAVTGCIFVSAEALCGNPGGSLNA